jgi:hypothetical protein
MRIFLLAIFAATLLVELSNFKLVDFTLTNDEIRVRDERLSMYPPEQLKAGYYLDQRQEVVASRKIINNVLSEFDLNRYFFAGHPRERVGVREYEKFPYIFLPIFLTGVYAAIRDKKYILGLFIVPVFVNALNASNSFLNNISLIPFIIVTIYLGAVYFIKALEKNKYKKYLYISFGVLLALVILQIIGYEIY